MAPEEEEISLVVESHHLSALEFGHWGEESLKETADCVTESGNETVHDKLWEVFRSTSMALESVSYLDSTNGCGLCSPIFSWRALST